MSDLISRQAAIDALERIFNRCEEIETHLPDGDPDKTGYKMFPDYMTVWKYLRQLPSEQQQQWIPCSERLPKKDGRYWISTKTIACEDNFENGEFVFYRSNVLAWMPLPEPWGGKQERPH